MHEAKTHLSQLVVGAETGEEIVIARKGVPVAKLLALGPLDTIAQGPGVGNLFSGELLDDWEETDADILKLCDNYRPENA
jgi:prevent-host-death family protein